MDIAIAVSQIFLAFSEGEMNGYHSKAHNQGKENRHDVYVLGVLATLF